MTRRKHKGHNINGIILFDKPPQYTSNQALQKVKGLLQASKAGHTGSLDPIATGLLPICLGEATKISNYLLTADKAYNVTCKLGVKTDSADADGKVIEIRPVNGVTEYQVNEVLQRFIGEIYQTPPMHSAIKKNGVPLYKLAHQGIVIEREPRLITIYAIELSRFEADTLELSVSCSKGTYIRTLVDDIGELLGCGAHVSALRRTQVGPFNTDHLVSLEQIMAISENGLAALDNILLPIEDALTLWPAVILSEDAAFFLQQGQPVFVARNKNKGYVRLFMGDNRFLGIGHMLDDGRVAPKRLMDLTKIG